MARRRACPGWGYRTSKRKGKIRVYCPSCDATRLVKPSGGQYLFPWHLPVYAGPYFR